MPPLESSTNPIVGVTRVEAVTQRLRAMIEAGEYGADLKIPPERQLAQRFGVNRLTVAKAISVLASEGWLERKVGSGTYVNPRTGDASPAESSGERPLRVVNVLLPMPPDADDSQTLLGRPGVAEAAYDYFSRRRAKIAVAFYRDPRELGPMLMDLAREEDAAHLIWYVRSHGAVEGLMVLARQRRVFCLVDAVEPEVPCDLVATDHTLGGRMLARALLDEGHETLAYITDELASHPTLRMRRAGFLAEAEAAGARVDVYSVDLPHLFESIIDQAVASDATAVGFSNDALALAFAARFKARGGRIPDDLSFIGFDGLDATRFFDPPLATVRQEFHRIGLAAADLLRQRWIEPDRAPTVRAIPPVTLMRASVRRRLTSK